MGGGELHQGRIVAWREGLGLVGVLLAAVLPSLLGLPVMIAVLALALAVGWLAWSQAPEPRRAETAVPGAPPAILPPNS